MPALVPINNFNSGELGKLLEARFDLDKYRAGCQKLENAFPLVEGGVKKAPGTYFAGQAKYPSKKCRLVPFSFSTNENYILEFGDQYVRVWKNGGVIAAYDSYTKLMLHCDSNTHGSDLFVDSSPSAHTMTPHNQCWIVTDQYKFGPGAGYFNRALSSYLSAPDSADWDLGTGAFTIDFWIRWNGWSALYSSNPDARGICGQWVDADNYWGIHLAYNGSFWLDFEARVSGTYVAAFSTDDPFPFQPDTWYHIAVIRGFAGVANRWTLCINGVSMVGASPWGTFSATMPDLAATMDIGRSGDTFMSPILRYHEGWIDEFRLSKGIARWTADFNVPAEPHLPTGAAYEISTPYLEQDLFDLDVNTQSADVLYIFHRKYAPRTLSRYGDANWTLAELAASGTTDVAKESSGIAKTISGATKANPCVISCIGHGFATNDVVYINGIVGMVELNWGTFTITKVDDNSFSLQGIDSSSYVTYTSGGYAAKVVSLFAAVGDYPACGSFHEQRLVVAGPDNHPQRMQASVQADFPNFICDPNQEDYALQFDMVSTKVDRLRWAISSPNALIFGTAGGVWAATASGVGALSQTNGDIKKQISTGVASIAPQLVNDAIIWVTRAAATVRLLLYNFITNQWESPDLTRLNRDVGKGSTKLTSGFAQTAFQAEPYPIFWAVRKDGQLLGMTFERQEQVYAWFRIVTDGIVLSVAVINRDSDEDEVWIAVQRSNGIMLEYFSTQELFASLDNAFFVHSGLRWTGPTPVGIGSVTQSNPCVVGAAGHGLITGNKVRITGAQGMTELNIAGYDTAYTVNVLSPSSFELVGVNSTGFNEYTGGGIAARVENTFTGLTHLNAKTIIALAGDSGITYTGQVPDGSVTLAYYAN